MVIRQEEAKDFDEIYSLIKTAFKTAKVSDGDEQDFANNLRKGSDYIQQLALVAELNDKIIGHIMFTKCRIECDEKDVFEGLLLAPLSVLIEHRGKGVGSKLVEEGFKQAKEMSYTTVFLCGYPDYYKRFGFKTISEYKNIKNTSTVPDEFLMAYELMPNALSNVKGHLNIV